MQSSKLNFVHFDLEPKYTHKCIWNGKISICEHTGLPLKSKELPVSWADWLDEMIGWGWVLRAAPIRWQTQQSGALQSPLHWHSCGVLCSERWAQLWGQTDGPLNDSSAEQSTTHYSGSNTTSLSLGLFICQMGHYYNYKAAMMTKWKNTWNACAQQHLTGPQ